MRHDMGTRVKGRSLGAPAVVVLGDVNLDLIAHFPHFPAAGQDALATSVEVHCGGSAANTAAALARLGLSARLIARVGREPMAQLALSCLREAGVLLEGVLRDPTCTTGLIYIIVTPDGERTMLSDRGANVHTHPDQVREAPFRRASLLHLSGYALLAEPQRSAGCKAIDYARAHGVPVSLDPGLLLCESVSGTVRDLLSAVDILEPTLAEAVALAGPASPEGCALGLLARGCRAVALKLGRDGCLLAAGGRVVHLPALAVRAQDTTGAGDAFNAGLIAGHLGGLGWVPAGLLANACGAVAASRAGAADRAPGAGEVAALLGSHLDHPSFAPYRTEIERALHFLSGPIFAGM